MANICYADFDITAPDEQHADKLENTLNSLMNKESNGVWYLSIAGCCLSDVYLDRCGMLLHIESTVKWGFNDKEVKALFRWFKKEADICEFVLRYEEDASHMYGEYVWDDMEPALIWQHYLPAKYWPEDENRDDYFDQIACRFEAHPKSRMIRLTRKKKTNKTENNK